MGLKKGDILDERKRYPDSCGLVIKLTGGGDGFQKIRCCGHELTEDDLVPDVLSSRGRKKGALLPGAMLEEKRQFADSCGLRVMVLDGGAGFEGIECCGHTITAGAVNDWKFGQSRQDPRMPVGPSGTA